MEDFALFTADAIRGVGVLLEALKSIPAAVNLPGLKFAMQATGLGILSKIGAAERKKQEAAAARAMNGLAHLAELESRYTAATLKSSKKLTTEELKQLKAKQLKAAIDKANLALGKGSNVFDMEKIQLAAAEKSAAEQLGKVTSQAQLLQITNDLARLEVKQSILDLEEAIKSNDVAAISNATNKLNADLKILGVLTNQDLKLRDIKSILDSMLPKDLINLANLDAAISKLKMLGGGTATSTSAVASTTTGTPSLLDALAAGSFVPVVGGGGYSSTAGNYASSGFPGSDMGYGGTTIVVNTGVGDPNAIAEAIDQVLQNARDRGTLRVG
jgi:hypothetical protein